MTFADPTRANAGELMKEQEREVSVKRLKDGVEMVVSNRLAMDLTARKPAEFVLLDKPTVMDEVVKVEVSGSMAGEEPTVVDITAPVVVDEVVEAPVAPEGVVGAE